jgi:hypothetical protein
MTVTETEFAQAQALASAQQQAGRATAARYDRRTSRVIVRLSNGVEIAVPTCLVQGLADALPDELDNIEISPSGLGLHWPKLDTDVYVPALLQGVFGSKQWMASQLGAIGGKARTTAKAAASRRNGRKGGRPHKTAAHAA